MRQMDSRHVSASSVLERNNAAAAAAVPPSLVPLARSATLSNTGTVASDSTTLPQKPPLRPIIATSQPITRAIPPTCVAPAPSSALAATAPAPLHSAIAASGVATRTRAPTLKQLPPIPNTPPAEMPQMVCSITAVLSLARSLCVSHHVRAYRCVLLYSTQNFSKKPVIKRG
jgi:hypothetical protein